LDTKSVGGWRLRAGDSQAPSLLIREEPILQPSTPLLLVHALLLLDDFDGPIDQNLLVGIGSMDDTKELIS
jgi:hypothetical protein